MFFLTVIITRNYFCLPSAKGRAIRKVIGWGGGGRSPRKEFVQGKIEWKQIHTQRVTQKKSF